MKLTIIAVGMGLLTFLSLRKTENHPVLLQPIVVTARHTPPDLQKFMNKLAQIESNNHSDVVNSFGMLGKYQFSPRTLRLMGITVSKEDFLSDTNLQDKALLMYMRENAEELRPVIKEFSGKTVNGVYITRSGILASAHLAGWGGVMSFFYPDKYHYPTSDFNGTSVAQYMKIFGGYNIKI